MSMPIHFHMLCLRNAFLLFATVISSYSHAFQRNCATSVLGANTALTRVDLITKAEGRSFWVRANIGSKVRRFLAHVQLEKESRIELPPEYFRSHGADLAEFNYIRRDDLDPSDPISSVRFPARLKKGDWRFYKNWKIEPWAKLKTMRDLMLGLLTINGRQAISDLLYILPLSHRGEMFHDIRQKGPVDEIKTAEENDSFTQEVNIKEQVYEKAKLTTHYNVDSVIGVSREVSIYFDTVDSSLWNEHRVTLRVKEWTPLGGELLSGRRRTLTLKKSKDEDDFFSEREEYQLSLPEDIRDEDIPILARALLKSKFPEVNDKVGSALAAQLEIENIRQAVNISYLDLRPFPEKDEFVKIGFLTFDTFRTRAIGKKKWSMWNYQMEAEFFTSFENQSFMNDRHIDLAEFMEVLLQRVNTTLRGPTRAVPNTRISFDPKMLNAR